MKKMCLSLDFISPRITLFYKGQLKHSSIPSVIISIISIITITVFSILFSLDFILRRNPTAFYYKSPIDDIPKIPFDSSGLFHFITFNENNGVYQNIDSHMINIIGMNYNPFYLYDLNYNRTLFDHWIYGQCDENDIKEHLNDLKDYKYNYKFGYCVKQFYNSTSKKFYNLNDEGFYYPYLQHGSSRDDSIHYGLLILKCQNNSYYDNNYNCYDNENISKYLIDSVGYNVYFLDKSIFINDYKNPLHYYFTRVLNLFNDKSYTINHLNFNAELLKTHKGIIFEVIDEHRTYIYNLNEKLTTDTDSINDCVLGGAYFYIKNIEEVYERKYKKIEEIVASVSGVINIILIIAKVFNHLFHNYYYLDELNKNINFYQENFEKLPSNKNLLNIDTPINRKNENNKEKAKVLNNNYLKDNNSYQQLNNKSVNFVEIKKNFTNAKKKSNNELDFKLISDIYIPKYKISDFNCFDFLLYKIFHIKTKRSKIAKKLDNFRKLIISEEVIFGIFYVVNNIQKVLKIGKR